MRNGEIGADWVCSVSLMGLNSFLARIDGEIQLLAVFPVLAATPTIEARHTSALRGAKAWPGREGEGQFDERLFDAGNLNLRTIGGAWQPRTAAQGSVVGPIRQDSSPPAGCLDPV